MKAYLVTEQEMLDKVLALRHDIFVIEQGVDPSIEHDHYDVLDNSEVEHFALVIKDEIVIGTCRCLKIDEHSVRLGRFAIHKNLRHQGFGLKFLRIIQDYYYHKQVENIIIHAQKEAIPFYTDAGYIPYGEPYLEAGIEHQNMRLVLYQHFYTRFADYYEQIFPVNDNKKQVIIDFIIDKETVLDIGCATGEVMEIINSSNKQASGIDLDARMIALAQEKNLNAWQMDMKEIDALQETYDGLLCLGNTLVHLDNLNEIDKFFKDAHQLLNNQGELFIQIVNYHRVLEKNVSQLPTLYSDSMDASLERYYEQKDEKIQFKNILTIAKNQYHSSVSLYPLTHDSLKQLATNNGFEVIGEFGSYNKDSFNPIESQQYLVHLKKANH